MPRPIWKPERLADRLASSRHPHDVPLVWVALSTAVGVLINQLSFSNLILLVVTFLVGLVSLLGWHAAWRQKAHHISSFLLLLTIICLAFFWNGSNQQIYDQRDLGRFARQDAMPVCIEAIVLASPRFYQAESRTPFHAIPPSDQSVTEIDVTRLRNGTDWKNIEGICSARINGKLELEVGDKIRLFGQLRLPSKPNNPGERNALQKSRSHRTTSIIWAESAACVEVLSKTNPFRLASIQECLTMIREATHRRTQEHFTDEVQPLASAMLVGDSSKLSPSVSERYRKTGVMHVLVVSGLHVGLVAGLPLLLGRFGLLSVGLSQITSGIFVVMYVLLVGAHPPALRACLVALSAITAASLDRKPLGINSLAGAAMSLFLFSPGVFQSAGTKLSFLAAATLLGVACWCSSLSKLNKQPINQLIKQYESPLRKIVKGIARWSGLLFIASGAVIATTGPLIAAEYHLISPIAILLNLPLMILTSIAIPTGLLAIALQSGIELIRFEPVRSMLEITAELLFTVSGTAIGWMDRLVLMGSNQSLGSFVTAGPASWWLIVWYLFLPLGIAFGFYCHNQRGLVLRLALSIIALGVTPIIGKTFFPNQTLRIHTIAVGHGSSILLQLPDGKSILYDAGALGSPRRSAEIISSALWAKGIERLDAVILSHADVDHYNAMPELLKRFSIGEVWTTHVMFDSWDFDSSQEGPLKLQHLLNEARIPIRELAADSRNGIFELSGVKFEVLHPTSLGVIGSDNANSLVLGIEHEGFRAVLTGDVEEEGLDKLLGSEPFDCDLLFAPHHGSQRSNPASLVEWCHPEWVVISSGADHPMTQSQYASSGATVLNTYRTGMISVSAGPRGATFRHYSH